jgi:hypothetical protein
MYTDSNVDADLVAAEVQKQLKTLGIVDDTEQKKVEPLKINLAGQDYSFNSVEEMQAALNTALSSVAENQAVLLQQLKDANESQQEKTPNAPKLDQEKFLEMLTKDPIAAMEYVDEFRYGPTKVNPAIQQELQRVQQLEAQLTAYRFINSHPEFENTDANAATLRQIAGKLNLPLDFQGLESAYTVGRSYGFFNATPQAPQEPSGRFQQNSTPVSAPPTVNRGGNSYTDSVVTSQLENLSLDQLRQIMDRG